MNEFKRIYSILKFFVLFWSLAAVYINMNSLKIAIEDRNFSIFYPLASLVYLLMFLMMYFLITELSNRNIKKKINILIIIIFFLVLLVIGVKLCSILMIINIFQ